LWRKFRAEVRERKSLVSDYEALAKRTEHVQEELRKAERQLGSAERASRRAADEADAERERLSAARVAAARAARAAEAARERAEKADVGPVGRQIEALPFQHLIAAAAAAVGGLGILGPGALTRLFLSVAGSILAGLLVASCLALLVHAQVEPGTRLLDAVFSVLEGKGPYAGYWLWLVASLLGVLRYLVGFECALWHYVDDVHVDESGRVVGIGSAASKPKSRRRPEESRRRPRPPAPQASGRRPPR